MSKKTNKIAILLGIIFFSIIVISIILFNNTVNEEFEDYERNTLIELANQQQIAINRQLESLVYNLVTMSETIALMGLEDESLLDYLTAKKSVLQFESASVANESGEVLLSTTTATDISNQEPFQQAMKADVYASETHISPYSDKEVITTAAPIYINNEIVGVLSVEFSVEYLGSLLTKFTDEDGLNLVVNKDSEIMVSTNQFVISFDAFATAEFNDGMTFEKVVSDFANGNSGSISYKLNGTQKLGEYRPIEINDWILFFEISEEKIAKSTTNISARMILISIAIIIFSFAIILIIMYSGKTYSKSLEKIAYYDGLTGSPNLLKFKMHVKEIVENNPNGKYGMVKFDVANFKAINEVYGFEVADKALCAIAKTGKNVEEKTFIQARVHADEFIMFSGGDDIEFLAERKDKYEAYFKSLLPELNEHNFYFRYGRYLIKPGETDVNEMINKTDIAHKFAKTKNMSNLWDYDDNYSKKVLKDVEIANKMKNAMKNNEFKAFLQPKISITKEELIGAEALVRWVEPNGDMVYPNEFIPLFEENGFIIELDKYMLRSVCEMLKTWKEKGKKLIPISVNFSRLHMHNLNFVHELKQIVSSFGVDTSYIEIELTETTVLENENELVRVLAQLREAGFLVSIDDFGSGYSSLGMLKNFEVNTLKLDRSFFVEANDDFAFKRGNHVVKSVIDLATALEMHTVAEGIESQEQIEFLKSINCYAAQGYYYSRPMPMSEFEQKYYS